MQDALDGDRGLVQRLEALANLHRILLLRSIRAPRALGEIVIRQDATGPPLSRQSVRHHLDTLIANGLVRARAGEREYGETSEYVIDHQRIFALSEELRNLARLRPTEDPDGQTMPSPHQPAPESPRPCFILASGLDVGAWYDLRPREGQDSWLIGRRRGSDIALDFDGALSGENTLVRHVDGQHVVETLPGSLNGTRVNGRQLAEGERRALAHGDIIGVGRCLLVYWR